ncbi:MAG TPA: hypothetical protein VFV99_22595 [Kofleriaceae bacterium]|nr:hypothetical protein [Kofleriaceae bacterium]
MKRSVVTLAVLGSFAGIAHAERARELATSAAFTPGILRATDTGNGFVNVASDFDGSTSSVRVSALGEVNLWWRVRGAVRLLDAFSDKPRPGVGAGLRWLDGETASTAYLFYKTEGFTEPEGEVEALLSFERAFGAVRASANIAYGQDPEGNERDGELAFIAHVEPRTGWFIGGTARYRDALGSTKEAVIRDGFAGPTSTLTLGAFAISLNAGVAMAETQMTARKFGPASTLSLGAAF